MGLHNRPARQSGVVLVLGLLLLVAITVLGIAAMSGTHMQERMAGNAKTQAWAFEAASAGVARSLEFWEAAQAAEPTLECDLPFQNDGWGPTAWSAPVAVGQGTLSQRLLCVATECRADDDEECLTGRRSTLFVENRGEVFAGTQRVARRDVLVRLTREFLEGSDLPVKDCGALCFPFCSFDGAGSLRDTLQVTGGGNLTADGEAGPAITFACQEQLDRWDAHLDDVRVDNLGGFATMDADDIPSPWNSPGLVDQFRENIIAAAQAQPAGLCSGARVGSCYNSGNISPTGNTTFGTDTDEGRRITYVEGNATMTGTITGAGILVVNGNLTWNGTPKFNGLIVVLGGTLSIGAGGGGGGDHAGSVIVLNAPSGAETFGQTHFNATGGGNAKFNFNCDAVLAARDLLDAEGRALWDPGCGGDGGGVTPGEDWFGEFRLESWRENIGWREDI